MIKKGLMIYISIGIIYTLYRLIFTYYGFSVKALFLWPVVMFPNVTKFIASSIIIWAIWYFGRRIG